MSGRLTVGRILVLSAAVHSTGKTAHDDDRAVGKEALPVISDVCF